MKYVRALEAVAVRHPETKEFVALDLRKRYRSDDPLVTAYGWAFAGDNDEVEQATRAPGERRNIRRGE